MPKKTYKQQEKYRQLELRRMLRHRVGIINSPLTDPREIIRLLRKPALREAAFRRLLEFEVQLGTNLLFRILDQYEDLTPLLFELTREMGITFQTVNLIDPNPELFGPPLDVPRVNRLLINTRVSAKYVLANTKKKTARPKAKALKKGSKKKKS